jgi:hypothetical protein
MPLRSPTRAAIRVLGRSLGRSFGRALSTPKRTLNGSHAPVGMLDLERITRVQPPISTITSRPFSTAFTSTSTKV